MIVVTVLVAAFAFILGDFHGWMARGRADREHFERFIGMSRTLDAERREIERALREIETKRRGP